MICHLFLKFLNGHISKRGSFSEKLTDSISVAKLRNFAQIYGYEISAGNIAGRRCFVSNDALDPYLACCAERVDGIGAAGALRFLRSLLAASLCLLASPPLYFHRRPGSRAGFLRPSARAKYVESRRSGEG